MTEFKLERETWIDRPIDEVFSFFGAPKNLEALTPAWLKFHVLRASEDPLKKGSTIDYRLSLHGVPLKWSSLISRWDPPHAFVDEQIRGPYSSWVHLHTFAEREGGTVIRDDVTYRVFGGRVINRFFVRRNLEQIFDERTALLHAVFSARKTSIGGG